MQVDAKELEDVVTRLTRAYPGRQTPIIELTTLLTTTAPPPCIHIHSPFSTRRTSSLMRDILRDIQVAHATIDIIGCFTPRLVFDHALLGLSGWQPQWSDDAGLSFGGGRYSITMGGFIEGLRAISRGKASGRNMVIVVERAERLKENVPELLVPLTRLAEMSGLPLTVIFLSNISWFDLRPLTGAALDPLLINIPRLPKEDALSTLTSQFPEKEIPPINPYSPLLKPLYRHYAETLLSVCSPFLADDHELSYLAAACWPSFVSPLLADWRVSASESGPDDPLRLELPSEESRMRLVRYFTPSLTGALETLYPRDQHALQWAASNAVAPELRLSNLMAHRDAGQPQGSQTRPREPADPRPELTTVAKYVLVAAFLASFNPAKTDVRLIGRAPDERGKKRSRRGVGPRKGTGANARVPQRLLGPSAFPLDRLLAIVGSLMEEHDRDGDPFEKSRRGDAGTDIDDQEVDVEMAVGRVQVSATIAELVAMRLLHRTTPAERLDGSPAFKCGISQSRAFELARELGMGSLADLMWDPS